eukprot:TRINITY_DN6619_c1_g1_i3.p2 TRINITY_DN6619_c1_g1~~TRINITY_DN6619_c1_g1_i3.p2  ORF type:complete len:238 (+),score=-15.65 TRINITY_DN6619_c1_g1_i3:546-1259(+)
MYDSILKESIHRIQDQKQTTVNFVCVFIVCINIPKVISEFLVFRCTIYIGQRQDLGIVYSSSSRMNVFITSIVGQRYVFVRTNACARINRQTSKQTNVRAQVSNNEETKIKVLVICVFRRRQTLCCLMTCMYIDACMYTRILFARSLVECFLCGFVCFSEYFIRIGVGKLLMLLFGLNKRRAHSFQRHDNRQRYLHRYIYYVESVCGQITNGQGSMSEKRTQSMYVSVWGVSKQTNV